MSRVLTTLLAASIMAISTAAWAGDAAARSPLADPSPTSADAPVAAWHVSMRQSRNPFGPRRTGHIEAHAGCCEGIFRGRIPCGFRSC